MNNLDPIVEQIISATEDGRHPEALALLTALYAEVCEARADEDGRHFITMFMWDQLAEDYPPALEALARARDEQVKLLLAGNNVFSVRQGWPRSRFLEIVRMNDSLRDAASTYQVFIQLKAALPDIAEREHYMALPAMVAMGDFALAAQYMPDPLGNLARLNADAAVLPLFPSRPAAPRMAAELSNFMKDVRLRAAILIGLGRKTEANAMQAAALAGIASDDMRAFAEREIAVPGTIVREMSKHQGDMDELH